MPPDIIATTGTINRELNFISGAMHNTAIPPVTNTTDTSMPTATGTKYSRSPSRLFTTADMAE